MFIASSTTAEAMSALTFIVDVLIPVKVLRAVGVGLGHVDRPDHTLLAQVSHEELQSDEGKDAQAEDGQDHHVRQLLHRLDQGAHNGLQAWGGAAHTSTKKTCRWYRRCHCPRYTTVLVCTSLKIIFCKCSYCWYTITGNIRFWRNL